MEVAMEKQQSSNFVEYIINKKILCTCSCIFLFKATRDVLKVIKLHLHRAVFN